MRQQLADAAVGLRRQTTSQDVFEVEEEIVALSLAHWVWLMMAAAEHSRKASPCALPNASRADAQAWVSAGLVMKYAEVLIHDGFEITQPFARFRLRELE